MRGLCSADDFVHRKARAEAALFAELQLRVPECALSSTKGRRAVTVRPTDAEWASWAELSLAAVCEFVCGGGMQRWRGALAPHTRRTWCLSYHVWTRGGVGFDGGGGARFHTARGGRFNTPRVLRTGERAWGGWGGG